MIRRPPRSTPLSLHDALPIYAMLLERVDVELDGTAVGTADLLVLQVDRERGVRAPASIDRKSTRLNSSHANISYAVFCLKKKMTEYPINTIRDLQFNLTNPIL